MTKKARNFKRVLAAVKKPAVAILGVSTVYVDSLGNEIALFAPDSATLQRMWERIANVPPFAKRMVQRTAVFRQTRLSSKKRLPRSA